MTYDEANDRLDLRMAQGFDASEVQTLTDCAGDDVPDDYGVRVRCSQCEVASINGIPCHETGCPNETRECSECAARVPKYARLCEDCAEQERADSDDYATEEGQQ